MSKHSQWVDPRYVQISRQEAASICGISTSEFDNRRSTDPDCPKGFKEGKSQNSRVRFRLSDVYAYSELMMERTTSSGA